MNKEYPISKLTMRDWSALDQPREKYILKGAEAISDAELIAIILRTGSSDESALDLAKRILNNCDNSLEKLSDLSFHDLTQIKGIGKTKAVTIQAAFEIGRRRRVEIISKRGKIKSPLNVLEFMQDKNADLPTEEFWIILLNQGGSILLSEKIGKGGLTSTTVDIRLILKKAIEISATSLVVCHNHPSGEINPSRIDISLTEQIREASQLLNIHLIDHIIIHKDRYYSFAENGYLTN